MRYSKGVKCLIGTGIAVALAGCPAKDRGTPTNGAAGKSSQPKSNSSTTDSNPLAKQSIEPSNTDSPNNISSDSQPLHLVPQHPNQTIHRICWLLPGGPLLIDIRMSVDGETLEVAQKRGLDELRSILLARLGTDSPTWEKVLEEPSVRSRIYGNLLPENEGQQDSFRRLYDQLANGIAEPNELDRFLSRGLVETETFTVFEADEFRGDNRIGSDIPLILDSSGDGKITFDELRSAPTRLSRLDGNQDDLISLAEVQTNIASDQLNVPDRRRRAGETQILSWNWFSPPNNIASRLLNEYGFGSPIQANAWDNQSNLFAALDSDQNGEIDRKEILQIAFTPATYRFNVRFRSLSSAATSTASAVKETIPKTSEDQPSLPEITIESLTTADVSGNQNLPFWQLLDERKMGDRFWLDLPSLRLLVQFEDPLAPQQWEVAVESLQTDSTSPISVDINDPRLPGLIGLERNALAESLAWGDVNKDGKFDETELRQLWLQRRMATLGLIRGRFAEVRDAWFAALDQQPDGYLTERELTAAADRLADWDRNGDGIISPSELKEQCWFVLGRISSATNPPSIVTIPEIIPRNNQSSTAPDWFLSMDINRDGEISAREFVGSPEQFQLLDRDQDNFLTREEIILPQ